MIETTKFDFGDWLMSFFSSFDAEKVSRLTTDDWEAKYVESDSGNVITVTNAVIDLGGGFYLLVDSSFKRQNGHKVKWGEFMDELKEGNNELANECKEYVTYTLENGGEILHELETVGENMFVDMLQAVATGGDDDHDTNFLPALELLEIAHDEGLPVRYCDYDGMTLDLSSRDNGFLIP